MKNLIKALSNFQSEVPIIHEATQGYSYTYADLKTIFEVIIPLLKKHGLVFTQLLQGDKLETVLYHIETGESLTSSVNMPQDIELKGMNAFQVAGSSITYFRRYSLSAMLGLITDIDNDASGEQKKTPTKNEAKAEPNKNEPEKWLNKFTSKDSSVLTPEWTNIIDGIKKGTVKSVNDVRKVYKVNSALALEITKEIEFYEVVAENRVDATDF